MAMQNIPARSLPWKPFSSCMGRISLARESKCWKQNHQNMRVKMDHLRNRKHKWDLKGMVWSLCMMTHMSVHRVWGNADLKCLQILFHKTINANIFHFSLLTENTIQMFSPLQPFCWDMNHVNDCYSTITNEKILLNGFIVNFVLTLHGQDIKIILY